VYGRAYERACGENRRAFKARLWAKQARMGARLWVMKPRF
jgi:hypothetical protein